MIERTSLVIGAFIFGILISFILSLIMAWPIMLLWNWIMPAVFKLMEITFWQSWGIMFLSSILFKGSISNTTNSK